jgi:general secretion pathway protein G
MVSLRIAYRWRGFTLIEMMVVISITLILISVAVPLYSRLIVRAKEAVLRQQLFTLRLLISQYTADKQKAPESLEALANDRYIRRLPSDPFTGRNDTWIVEMEADSTDGASGISDVRSGSNLTSSEGNTYDSW